MNSFLLIPVLALTLSGQDTKPAPTPGRVIPVQNAQARNTALDQMVAAERAFSRRCGEVGLRDSFLAFFADDGISWAPAPGNAKERLKSRPSGKGSTTLEWQPEYADMARSADLGYDTGPYIFSDPANKQTPKSYGYFFSIWKKLPDGTWKVAADFGAPSPLRTSATWPPEVNAPPSPYSTKSNADIDNETAALIQLERAFSREASAKGAEAAYAAHSSWPEVRLLRPDHFAMVGLPAVRKFFKAANLTITWEPLKGAVSSTADLGYTYGAIETSKGAKLKKGNYLHVWKRNDKGEWKLVAEVVNGID